MAFGNINKCCGQDPALVRERSTYNLLYKDSYGHMKI